MTVLRCTCRIYGCTVCNFLCRFRPGFPSSFRPSRIRCIQIEPSNRWLLQRLTAAVVSTCVIVASSGTVFDSCIPTHLLHIFLNSFRCLDHIAWSHIVLHSVVILVAYTFLVSPAGSHFLKSHFLNVPHSFILFQCSSADFFCCAHKTVPAPCFVHDHLWEPLHFIMRLSQFVWSHSSSSSFHLTLILRFQSLCICWSLFPPHRVCMHQNASDHFISLFGLILVKDFLLVTPSALHASATPRFLLLFQQTFFLAILIWFARNHSQFKPLLTHSFCRTCNVTNDGTRTSKWQRVTKKKKKQDMLGMRRSRWDRRVIKSLGDDVRVVAMERVVAVVRREWIVTPVSKISEHHVRMVVVVRREWIATPVSQNSEHHVRMVAQLRRERVVAHDLANSSFGISKAPSAGRSFNDMRGS